MVGRWGLVCHVAVLSLALALPAAAQEPPTDAPSDLATEPPVGEAELAALTQSRAAVAARMGASAASESRRRHAEEAVVQAHRDLRSAVVAHDAVVATLDTARHDLYDARHLQDLAQQHFDKAVAETYKYGGAQATATLMTAVQSATDIHDLARVVSELDGILGHGYATLEARIRGVASTEARIGRLQRLLAVAQADVAAAEAAIGPAEEGADRSRSVARSHEVALLDAASRALDAEEAFLALDTDLPLAAMPADPLAAGSASVDPDAGPSVEQRRSWLANRRGVVGGQAHLPSAAWLARPDVVCPVAGATFSNDFHNPRSHGRRHLGTDLFADRGIPVVALAAGEVSDVDPTDGHDGDHDLGGITVSWTTDIGRFYAAHLDRIAAGLEVGDRVEAGQVVGYVGDSGNARGGAPHLHLGWLVDGVEVNPYPTLALVCRPR